MKKYIKPSTEIVKIATDYIMTASNYYNEFSDAEQLSREITFDVESEIMTNDDFE